MKFINLRYVDFNEKVSIFRHYYIRKEKKT